MNTGSAVERAGDWFGAAVNLAARVASEAEGCEVLLTQSTVDLAGEVVGIRLKPLGERRLKNVSQPVRIYRASRQGVPEISLVVDPVCRMSLRGQQPTRVLVHDGAEFRFCSHSCADAFAADPDSFTR